MTTIPVTHDNSPNFKSEYVILESESDDATVIQLKPAYQKAQWPTLPWTPFFKRYMILGITLLIGFLLKVATTYECRNTYDEYNQNSNDNVY